MKSWLVLCRMIRCQQSALTKPLCNIKTSRFLVVVAAEALDLGVISHNITGCNARDEEQQPKLWETSDSDCGILEENTIAVLESLKFLSLKISCLLLEIIWSCLFIFILLWVWPVGIWVFVRTDFFKTVGHELCLKTINIWVLQWTWQWLFYLIFELYCLVIIDHYQVFLIISTCVKHFLKFYSSWNQPSKMSTFDNNFMFFLVWNHCFLFVHRILL